MSPGMLHELQIIHAALGRLITLAEGEVSSPNSEADGDEIMALKPLRDMLDEARKGSVLENEESQRPKDAFDELPRIEGAILRTIAHNPTWTYAQVAERVKRQHPGSSPSEKSIADIVHEARKHPEKRNLLPPNRRHGRKY